MRISTTWLVALAVVVGACSSQSSAPEAERVSSADTPVSGVQSAIPADRLAAIKGVLPKVAWPRLQAIFADPDTFWYDHASMQPSYQETGAPGGGAKDNAHWRDLVADTGSTDPNSNPAVGGEKVYDNVTKRWRFPFGTTAGTDDSTNLVLVEFLSLPKNASGKIQAIPISNGQDQVHLWWQAGEQGAQGN